MGSRNDSIEKSISKWLTELGLLCRDLRYPCIVSATSADTNFSCSADTPPTFMTILQYWSRPDRFHGVLVPVPTGSPVPLLIRICAESPLPIPPSCSIFFCQISQSQIKKKNLSSGRTTDESTYCGHVSIPTRRPTSNTIDSCRFTFLLVFSQRFSR